MSSQAGLVLDYLFIYLFIAFSFRIQQLCDKLEFYHTYGVVVIYAMLCSVDLLLTFSFSSFFFLFFR